MIITKVAAAGAVLATLCPGAALAGHPTAECNGNGILYPDTAPLFPDQNLTAATRCECFPCFAGDACETPAETKAANCLPLDASVGTAVMAEYWEDNWDDATLDTTVPSYYRCEYQDPTVMPAFLSGQNANTLEAIQRLHAKTGNAVTKNKAVILGDGATEVVRLVLEAIAATEGHPMVVTARAPYYPNFEYWGDENPSVATFTKDASSVDASKLVEIVTFVRVAT